MKKLIIVLFLGLSLTLAVSACSKTDIEKARNVVDKSEQLLSKGDIEDERALFTVNGQKKYDKNVDENYVIIIQNSEYEIKDVKQEGEKIYIKQEYLGPDLDSIAISIIDDIINQVTEPEDDLLAMVMEVLQSGDFPKSKTASINVLVKEDGVWKIDDWYEAEIE